MIKVMIVDDEALERRALRRFLQEVQEVEVVGEARNGIEAVELARRLMPDLAFVDIKMPGLNGLQAIREIQRINPKMISIILTAYDEFEYAQDAIKLGALDYVLKPARQEDILTAARSAVARMRESRSREEDERRLREQLRESMPYIQTALVLDLIGGTEVELESLKRRAEFLGIPGLPNLALVLNIDGFSQATDGKEEVEKQILKNQVFQAVQKALATEGPALLSPVGGADFVLLSTATIGDPKEAKALGLRLGEQVRAAVEASTSVSVTVGVGRLAEDFKLLSASYQEAINARLLGKFFFGGNRVVHIDDLAPFHGEIQGYPLELEKSLAERVRWGDQVGAGQAAEKLVARLRETRRPWNEVIFRMLELVAVLSRAAAEGGGDPDRVIGLNIFLFQELQGCDGAAPLRDWIQKVVDRFTGLVAEQGKTRAAKVVKRVMRFIDGHYGEDISMEAVAKLVYLDPSYFCRVFKQETGRTFLEYLTAVRVDRAKDFLATTDLPVFEIAGQVGYPDPNYFSRVFLKGVGLTPSEFRTGINLRKRKPSYF